MPTRNPTIIIALCSLSAMGCGANSSTANATLNQSANPASIATASTAASSATPNLEPQSLSQSFIDAAEQPDFVDTMEASISELTCGASSAQFQTLFIDLINQARAQPRQCGDTSHETASPLRWNSKLAQAAQRHSLDMATNDFFSHTGSDNSKAADRVDAVSYEWQTVGENLAAGQVSLEEAINGWLDSPGHCRNIMNTDFKEAGLACVENQSTEFGTYWTNVFAAEFE